MKENKEKNEHNQYVRILNVKAVDLDWRISRVSRLQHVVIKDWKKKMVEGEGNQPQYLISLLYNWNKVQKNSCISC